MERISFHLNVFDGPLDLLLHLVAKNKVNIYDIPIAEILEQYMEYLDAMEARSIELSSDFAAMAAQLLYIKSKMLLPVYEDEEEEDPRVRLVEMLLEYQRIKGVSSYFGKQGEIGRDIFIKPPEPLMPNTKYEYWHAPEELKTALLRMADRSGRKMPPPVSVFAGVVGREKASVSERITRILDILLAKGQATFCDVLSGTKDRSEMVAAFLAVLELSKDRKIRIDDLDGDYVFTLMPAEEAKDEGLYENDEAFY